jgi:hypothetical protein
MKHRMLAYALIPVIGLGLLGAGVASAHGMFGGTMSSLTPDQIATRQQAMFQNEANLLGISVDAVKAAWAQGKTFAQMAQDNGITQAQLQQKMQDAWMQQLKTQLQALVDNGVITQAQSDARLQAVQSRMQQSTSAGKTFRRGLRF